MAKKILITGSNGLLGQKIIEQLIDQQELSWIATSNGKNRMSQMPEGKYQSLDITNEGQIKRVFE